MNCECCKKCDHRTLGCHSTCAGYLEFKKKVKEEKKKAREYKIIFAYEKRKKR